MGICDGRRVGKIGNIAEIVQVQANLSLCVFLGYAYVACLFRCSSTHVISVRYENNITPFTRIVAILL